MICSKEEDIRNAGLGTDKTPASPPGQEKEKTQRISSSTIKGYLKRISKDIKHNKRKSNAIKGNQTQSKKHELRPDLPDPG